MLRRMAEETYRKTFLQGGDENELWLPLLEKAYAKAHGDYQAINGGFTGEAIEVCCNYGLHLLLTLSRILRAALRLKLGVKTF